MSDYVKDVKKIASLMDEDDDGKCIAKEDLYIIFPERYLMVNLAVFSSIIEVLGCVMIADTKRNYAVTMITGLVRFNSDDIDKIVIDGIPHFRFKINAGSNMYNSNEMVENKKLTYHIYSEIIEKAKNPVYFDEADRVDCMNNVKPHNGVTLFKSINIMNMLIGLTIRDSKDLAAHYRNTDRKNPIEYLPLNDPVYGISGGMARLTSSNISNNLTGLLMEDNIEVNDIERYTRG